MDKIWCDKCNDYTNQTTGGCVKCGQVTWIQRNPMGIEGPVQNIELTNKDFQLFIEECGLDKMEDLQPEIVTLVNDNFWDLI